MSFGCPVSVVGSRDRVCLYSLFGNYEGRCFRGKGRMARGGSIPQRWGCDRRATKPQAKFGATRRAAGPFRPDFVARSLQIHGGICSSLAPRLSEKSLAANVIGFMFMTTKASTYQMYHRDTFDNPLSHSMFQNPLLVTPSSTLPGAKCPVS